MYTSQTKTKFTNYSLLAVDDDTSILGVVQEYVSDYEGFSFNGFSTPKEAISWARQNHFDIALIDYNMPEMDGIELTKILRKTNPETYFIIMTAHEDVDIIIQAIRTEIFDFILKPYLFSELKMSFERIKKHIKLKEHNKALVAKVEMYKYGRRKHLLGVSKEMIEVREKIALFAKSDAPVLITGETGVGKEIVSNMLHSLSNRNQCPFIAVNCSAYVETLLESELFGHEKGSFTGADKQRIGRIELAQKGSIFFDELCEIPLHVQVKLLRVLQEKEFERVGGNNTIKVQARILSATNRNVEEEIKSNRLREDLYYRLNTLHINIPPLRDRREDIVVFADYFLRKYSLANNKEIPSFSDESMEIIHNHLWPGNVRQMENVINHAVICCDGNTICKNHLPAEILKKEVEIPLQEKVIKRTLKIDDSLPSIISNLEREKIIACLEKNRWNKSKTATALGFTRGQLLYRIKKHKI